jgi:uncharacterized membrane protein
MKKEYIFGALINFASLFLYSLFYQVIFRELVIRVKWLSFLGDEWFFMLVSLVAPAVLFKKGKRKMAIGALLGVVVYFLFVLLMTTTIGVA